MKWWLDKAILFAILLVFAFIISPNGARSGSMCGLGFTSYCTTAR